MLKKALFILISFSLFFSFCLYTETLKNSELLVKVHKTVNQKTVLKLFNKHHLKVIDYVKALQLYRVKIISGQKPEIIIKKLKKSKRIIIYAEPNTQVEALGK